MKKLLTSNDVDQVVDGLVHEAHTSGAPVSFWEKKMIKQTKKFKKRKTLRVLSKRSANHSPLLVARLAKAGEEEDVETTLPEGSL